MKLSTRYIIFIVYSISQLMGLLGFSYNFKTFKVEKNLFITVYSGIISALLFCMVPLFFCNHWQPSKFNGSQLHIKITTVMCLIYIAATLVTVILNWIKRLQFMKTIEDFQSLRENFLKKFQISEKVQLYYEKTISSKFYIGGLSNIISFFFSYDLLNDVLDVESPFIIMALLATANILNILMDHYFFAILNINVLLCVVNEEIERILNTSSVLFELQCLKKIKAGYLVITCCELSDQLDELAIQHYQLMNIAERVNKLYDLHGACVLLTLYLNNISCIYMTYMIIQHKELSQKYGVAMMLLILAISLFFFYKDLHIFIANMLYYGDLANETANLLNNRQIWLPTLDERLENSLKQFSIQLAVFPFQMKLLGMFHFNRSTIFATFGSTVSNAIVLMQYDYKYSED